MNRLIGFGRSLAARLVIGAVAWSLLILVIGGVLLSQQYRDSAMRSLDGDLRVVLDGLIASADVGADGALALRQTPNDQRFQTPSSGRYWQIAPLTQGIAPTPVQQSQSLWDEASLPWPTGGAAPLADRKGETRYANVTGPFDQPVRLAVQVVTLPGAETPYAFFAAADRRPALIDARRFTTTLALALAVMAAGLIAMVVLQVRVGLAPLNRLRGDVAEVRRGKRARLDGEYPTEVAPLTDELNALLDHNRAVVDRARTHVGNLAHALKTPISVMLNEARAEKGPLAELVTRQSEAMRRNVDHYLQRAQAAARAETMGARTEVQPVIDDIARTLERLFGRQKDMDIHVAPGPALVFRGERQDLEEMAGNLMENACKYGGGAVHVAVREGQAPHTLEIAIGDDGPGLAPEAREAALTRGVRLDETAPGQGLGLSIVAEFARLYGGALVLGESSLGGLEATLRLPATD
ncbi:MAG: sensor histidine kinase [Alphaproteobacteria bacterium]|nr:MAG: sensor histidine kinase [Caulobacteraceae bacterium]TPW05376.1 MAG: sensor histidine kinase [Alphaproteobacteria bacterium]